MKRDEDKVHVAILDWIRTVAPQCLPFHVPNEGERTASAAVNLQRLGLVPGIPDLAILAPGGRVYFIEVKAQGGVLSKAQRAINDRFLEMGQPYAVCRSIDDARVAFKHWKLDTREVTP